jgi:hypothetical protein
MYCCLNRMSNRFTRVWRIWLLLLTLLGSVFRANAQDCACANTVCSPEASCCIAACSSLRLCPPIIAGPLERLNPNSRIANDLPEFLYCASPGSQTAIRILVSRGSSSVGGRFLLFDDQGNQVFGAAGSSFFEFQAPNPPPGVASITREYTLKYGNSPTCISAGAVFLVTIEQPPAPPAITAPKTVCAGENFTITAQRNPNFSLELLQPIPFGLSGEPYNLAGSINQTARINWLVYSPQRACSTQFSYNVNVLQPPFVAGLEKDNYCAGIRLELAPNPEGGVWEPANFFEDNIFTPPANFSGSIELVYKLNSSQSCAFRKTVNIIEPPQLQPVIMEQGPFCIGQTIGLSANAIPGANYQWRGPAPNNPLLFSNDRAPRITLLSSAYSGTYTLSAQLSNAVCPTLEETVSLFVQDIPALRPQTNAPSSGLCVPRGGCTPLLFSHPVLNNFPDAQFLWKGPKGNFAGAEASACADASFSGIYTLEVTLPGCNNLKRLQTFSVNIRETEVLAAPSPLLLCEAPGANFTLNAPPIAGATFTWAGPAGNATGPTYTRAAVQTHTGVYSLTLNWSDGCPAQTLAYPVTINKPPSAPALTSNSPLCAGQQLRLTASFLPGVTYLWRTPSSTQDITGGNELAIPNAQPATHSGVYTLTVAAPGCSAVTSVINVQVNQNPDPAALSLTTNTQERVCNNLRTNLQLNLAPFTPGWQMSWSGPGGFSQTTRFGELWVENARPGIYTAIVAAPGCLDPVVKSVNIIGIDTLPLQLPIRLQQTGTHFCQPASVNLALELAAPPAGVTYTWLGANTPALPHTAQLNLTGLTAGIYNYTLQAERAPCPTRFSNTVRFTVNAPYNGTAAIRPSNLVVCEGASIALTATSIPGARYTWQCPSCTTLPCAGQDSVFFRPNAALGPCYSGVYSALIEVPGCGSWVRSAQVQVLEWPTRISIEGTSLLCEGQEIRLKTTCFPQATYQWTRNGVVISSSASCELVLPASAANAGCYSVTIVPPSTSGNACLPAQSPAFCVTVKPLPNLQLTSGKLAYCKGEELSLQAQLSPPPVQSSPLEFQWIFPYAPSPAPGKGAVVTFRAQQSGVYKYQVNIEGCGLLESPPLPLIVDEIPNFSIIPSNPVLCPGTANFSLRVEPPIAGGEFTWQGPNSLKTFPKISNDPVGKIELGPSITYADSGAYTVVVEKGACAGAFAKIASANVHALSRPTITVPETVAVCKGSPLSINATLSAGFNPFNTRLTWTPLGGVQARDLLNFNSFTRENMQPNDAGDYLLQARVGNCPIETYRVQVTVVDWPSVLAISGPEAPICVSPATSATATLSAPQLGNNADVTYLWQGPHPNVATNGNTPTLLLTNLTAQNSGLYTVRVKHNTCGRELSANFPLTVISLPQLELTPERQTICGGGGSANLCVRPKDGGVLPEHLTYRWQLPATSVRSAINIADCFNISGITSADSGDYFVRVTYPGCPTQNLRATLNVLSRIERLSPVAGLINACAGDALLLQVSPNRSYLNYTWRKNGSLISPLVEGVVLAIPSASPADAGFYTIEAAIEGANCPNLTTATSITVRVDSLPGRIRIQPLLGAAVCSNAGASFRIAENLRVPPHSIEWFRPGGSAPFATGNSAFDPAPRSGLYRVKVTTLGCGGNFLEDTIRIQVGTLPTLPANFPSQLELCSGNRLVFNYFANPCNSCVYRWSGPGNFSSTAPNPIVSDSLSARQAGVYRLVLSAAGCDSVIREIKVTVNTLALDLNVTSNSPICEGQTLQFTALCANCPGAVYNWSGPGGFTSTFQNPTLTSARVSNSGTYTLRLSISGCSEPIPILVPAAVNAQPAITLPAETTFCRGQLARLTHSCPPGADCAYAWKGPKTSATADLVFNPIQSADAGIYTLELTTPGCKPAAASILVRVSQIDTPRIFPNKSTLCAGESLRFTASPAQSGAHYEWLGPVSIPNNRQLIPGEILAPQRGLYTLRVTLPGSPCPALEVSSTIEINPTPAKPLITAPRVVFCSGESISLFASEGGPDPITIPGTVYLWYIPGQETPQTSNPLQISNATPAQSGEYRVIAVAGGCSSLAGSINLRVEPVQVPPNVIGRDTAFCQGGVARLNALTIPGANYLWVGPGVLVPTSPQQVIPNLPAGVYTYALIITAGGCAADTSLWQVTVHPNPGLTLAASVTVCQGQSVTIPILNLSGAYPLRLESNISSPPFIIGEGQSALVLPSNLVSASRDVTFTRVTDAKRCTAILNAQTQIRVESRPPTPLFPIFNPICEGSNLNLLASVSSSAGLNFNWLGPLGSAHTSATPSWNRGAATVEMSGEYKLVAERKIDAQLSCFSDTARLKVRVEPSPQVAFSIIGSATPCAGDSIRFRVEFLRGNPGFRFSFSPLGRVYTSQQNTIEFAALAPSSAQQYSVSQLASSVGVVGSVGCPLTVNPPAPIAVQPQPGLSPTAIRSVVQNAGCAGAGSITLSVSATGNLVPVTYDLLDPNRNLVAVATEPLFASVTPGKYIVRANLANGCATSTAPVTVFGAPGNVIVERLCDSRNVASLRISWNNPIFGESGLSQSFYVRLRKKGQATWQCVTARTVQSTEVVPNATLTLGGVCNLQPDSTYEAQVVATNNPSEVTSNNNIAWSSCLAEFTFRACATGGGGIGGGGGLCAIPSDFKITSVTSGDATFTWSNAGGVSLFEFEVLQGAQVPTGPRETVPANRNRYSVSLPFRQMDYSFRVTPICSDGSRGAAQIYGPVRTPRLGVLAVESLQQVSVYPNPTQGLFNVQYQGLQEGAATLTIFDARGSLAHTQTLRLAATEGLLSFRDLPLSAGVYTLIFKQGGYQSQTRLVVWP